MAGFWSHNASFTALQYLMKLDVSYDNCPQLGSSLEIRHNLFAIWWDTLLILPWPAGTGSPQVASRAKSRREQLRAAGVVVEGRKSGWRGVSLVQAPFKIRRIITSVLILSCHRKKKKTNSCVMARTGKDSDIHSYIHKAKAQTRLATTTNMVSITEGILSYPIEI